MATRTKQIALDEIQGTFREQYKRIYHYAHELLRENPGSSVRIQVQRSPDLDNAAQASSMTNYCIFQRIYVCLKACKQSFQHCRSFIGLDDYFLKTPQGGQLLTAIGWDPNDQMLPIAYAVVEAETKDSWTWFLNHLASDIGIEKMRRTTFMSDQQKGLLLAYEDVIPGVENRFCCAKVTHWRDWDRYMVELKAVNQEAFRYLDAIPPRYWSRSRFTYNSKVDTLVNNMSESFNVAIVDAREKPIVTMLEDIRLHQVQRLGLESYVADCYKREAYLRCYEAVIHPLNEPDLWERTAHPDVMPPPYRRPSHRRVKKRKTVAKDEEQSSRTHMSRKGEKQRCSICDSVGHNKNRCPKPIEDEIC
ncbi:uncharacterized protein LOC107606698 [Arachis ipaensis]|uniref:uncharacterized protein LOC107606698 n=1 Tax=Arachis ipaensis TaxID=130454 RepID=UPI0007AF3F0B|nr:uncharacterized protein LOC107606698 [Arachis ipaensis]XP_025664357.1 uncharacterized protein LOC112762715 [Arachis hypogaea]